MYINLSLLIFLLWDTSDAQSFNVYVNTSSSVRSVPDKFLSISFDSSNADSPNWWGLNFSYIEPLASALKPVYFRFGGTASNFVTFQATSTNKDGAKIGNAWSGNFTITGAQFDQLYTFTKNVGWRLIFDLSDLFNRNSTNATLDLSNAKVLIDYASSKGYDLDFELGNEPDCVHPRISGAQMAQDYQALRSLLNSYDVYKNSIIIGPSTCNSDVGYLGDFLHNNGGNYINGLSFHQSVYKLKKQNAKPWNLSDSPRNRMKYPRPSDFVPENPQAEPSKNPKSSKGRLAYFQDSSKD